MSGDLCDCPEWQVTLNLYELGIWQGLIVTAIKPLIRMIITLSLVPFATHTAWVYAPVKLELRPHTWEYVPVKLELLPRAKKNPAK